MKVLQDTPDRLILDETPWFLALMLAGFILIFVGSGLFIMSSELVLSAGRHPLVTAYSNLSGPPKMVAAINAWL